MNEEADFLFEDPDAPPVAETTDDLFEASTLDQINEALNQENARLGGFDPIDPMVSGSIQEGGLGISEAIARKYDTESNVMKVLNTFAIPQEIATRGAVKAMQITGAMSDESAKRILSESDVSPSDLMNFYWKQPESLGGKAVRGTLGLVADILVDPLGIFNIWSKAKKGQEIVVKGQKIEMKLLSAAERLKVKQAANLQKIIKSDGAVVDAAEELLPPVEKAINAAKKLPGFSADDLLQQTMTGASQAQIQEALQTAEKSERFLEQLKTGERGFSMGFQIPFLTGYHQVDVPWLSKMTTQPLAKMLDAGLTWGGDKVLDPIIRHPVYDTLSRHARAFRSRTGNAIYDMGKTFSFGDEKRKIQYLDDLESKWHKTLDKYDEDVIMAAIDEMEFGQVEDIGAVLRAHEKKAFEADPEALLKAQAELGLKKPTQQGQFVTGIEQIATPIRETKEMRSIQPTAADLARRSWLQEKAPDVVEMLDEMRDLNKSFVDQYKMRPGMLFEELNPFGPGWARTYIKHRYSDEYQKSIKDLGDQLGHTREMLGATKKVDASAKGREYRGGINEANIINLLKTSKTNVAIEDIAKMAAGTYEERAAVINKLIDSGGIKMFIDDPVKLSVMRAKEMARTIKNYDLMDAASAHAIVSDGTEKIPRGFVKFKLKDFENLLLERTGNKINAEDSLKMFIPDFYKKNPHIYLPDMVYDDLIYNLNTTTSSNILKIADDAFTKMNSIVRNVFLSGGAYLGRNMNTNMTTYALAGPTSPTALPDAFGMLSPFYNAGGKYKFSDAVGNTYELTKEQVWNSAVQHGVIGAGYSAVGDNTTLANMLSEGWKDRKKVGYKLKDAADILMLWRPTRAVAQYADDVPRLALYIDRMRAGFSPEASAEIVHKYFYNYGDSLKTFSRARKYAGAFLSYPVKTMERAFSELRAGELGRLSVPAKVNEVLQGAWVEEPDVRDQLDVLIPDFQKKGFDRIHGPLLPGGIEVVQEAPWAYGAMASFFDPQQNIHPMIQMLAAYTAAKESRESVNEAIDPTMPGALERFRDNNYRGMLRTVPSWLREGLALAELNGVFDFNGQFSDHFASRYMDKIPISEGTDTDYKGTRFASALEFAKHLEKTRGENWFYNLMFPKGLNVENDIDEGNMRGMLRATQRANYIQKHFSDLTLGLASMNNMDRQFFIYNAAMDKRVQFHTKSLEEEMAQTGAVMAPDAVENEDVLMNLAQTSEHARAIYLISKKQSALASYYNWYLGVEKKYPKMNIWGLLFGSTLYDYDKEDKPDITEIEADFKSEDPTADEDVRNLLELDQTQGDENE